MEVAELTAVLRVQTTGFMSAMEDADTALKNTQSNIEAVEKSAVGLGVALETAFAKGVDASPLLASIKEVGAAVDGLIENITDIGPITERAATVASENLQRVGGAAAASAALVQDLQVSIDSVGRVRTSGSAFSPLSDSANAARNTVAAVVSEVSKVGPRTVTSTQDAMVGINDLAVDVEGVVAKIKASLAGLDSGTNVGLDKTVQLVAELAATADEAKVQLGLLVTELQALNKTALTPTASIELAAMLKTATQTVAEIKALGVVLNALGPEAAKSVTAANGSFGTLRTTIFDTKEESVALEKSLLAIGEGSIGLGAGLKESFAGVAGEIETAAANIRAAVSEISATRLIIPVSAEVVATTSPVAAEAGATAKQQAAATSEAWAEVNASIASVVATLAETNTALTALVAAMGAGAKKVVEDQASATAAVEKTKAAIKSTGAAAVEEAATEVAAVEEVKVSRKELIAILEQSRLAYSMEEEASFAGARARLARDNHRRSIANIKQGGGPTPNRFAGLPVRAGNTESGIFIGAQESFYAQRAAMQAAAVEAEAYARVLGLVGGDSEDAALATQMLNRAINAAGPYATETARQMAGLLSVTEAWSAAEAEAGARAQSDAVKVNALKTELVSLRGVAASLGPIVPTVNVAQAEARIAELRTMLEAEYATHPELYGLGPAGPRQPGPPRRLPSQIPQAPFNIQNIEPSETPAYQYQREIERLQAEIRKATSGAGAMAPVNGALNEAKARIAEIERELQAVSPGVTRLYRGEGEGHMSLAEQGLTAGSETSYFTSDKEFAAAHDTGGGVHYVDVPTKSLPQYADAGAPGNYLLPGTIAEQAKLLQTLEAQEGATAGAANTLSDALKAQMQTWDAVKAQQASLAESLTGVMNRITLLRGELTGLAAGSQEWKNAVYLLNQAQTEQLAKLTEIDAATSRFAAQQRVANAILTDAAPITARATDGIAALVRGDDALTVSLANAEAAVAKNVSSLELLAREARAAEIVAAELKGELDLGAAAADLSSVKQAELARALQSTSLAALTATENLGAVAAAAKAAFNVGSEKYQTNLLLQQQALTAAQNARAELETAGASKQSPAYMAAVVAEAEALRNIQQAINGYQDISIEQLNKIRTLEDIILLVEEKRDAAAKAAMSEDEKRTAGAKKYLATLDQQIAAAAALKAELLAGGVIPAAGNLPVEQQLILSQGVKAEAERAAIQASAAKSFAAEAEAAKARGESEKIVLSALEQEEAAIKVIADNLNAEVEAQKANLALARETLAAYQAQGTATERLVAEQKVAAAQVGLQAALVAAGQAPHEAKAAVAGGGTRTPVVTARRTQLESPFSKGAAEEIDAVAKSTRGAAGSFFDLGTAAAFASSAFLIGLFGGTALRKVVDAARDLSTAQALLGNAVRNTGEDWDVQREAVSRYIEKVASLSGFTDTELTTSMTKLVVATGDVKLAQNGLGIATDLARAKNLELATAVKDVVLVSEGHASILRRQGIVLPVVTSAMDALKERLAKAADAGVHFTAASKLAATQLAKGHDLAATAALDMVVLRNSVAGADAAYLKSSKGGIAEFGVALERLEVSIGNAIIPALDGVVRSLAKVLEGWEKSGAAARAASEGINTFIQAVQLVKPIVVDLFDAVRDGIAVMGGLKAEIEILATFWVTKFLVVEHPMLAILVLLDQLATHIDALKGVVGPLVGFLGTVFLAWKIGFLDAIAKVFVFSGAVKQGDFEFTSMTTKILAGLKVIGFEIDATTGKLVRMGATAAEAGTVANVAATGGGGAVVREAEGAVVAGGVGASATKAAKGVAGRVGKYTGTMVAPVVEEELAVGAAAGTAAVGETAALSGLAAFLPVLGPLAIGLGVAGAAFLLFGHQMSDADKAARSLDKALNSTGQALRNLPTLRVARDQAELALEQAKATLATLRNQKGSVAYRNALDQVAAAEENVRQAQRALSEGSNKYNQSIRDAVGDMKNLNDALEAQRDHIVKVNGEYVIQIRTGHGVVNIHKSAQDAAENAAKATKDWTDKVNALILKYQQSDPLIAHNLMLIEQLKGQVNQLSDKDITIILHNKGIHESLADLLAQLKDIPPEIVIKITEAYNQAVPPAVQARLAAGQATRQANAAAGPHDYTVVPQKIRNAIADAQAAEALHPSAKNVAAEVAALRQAIAFLNQYKPTAKTREAYDNDIVSYQNALKALLAPPPDLTVKPDSSTGGGKLTGLAAQIGPKKANIYEAAKAAAASAGSVQAGTFDPKILEAQQKLRQTVLSTMAALRAEQHKVGATSKEGVAIQKELVGLTREATASLKVIEKEKAFKEAAAVHKKIDSVLGIGQPSQGDVTVTRARREEHNTLVGILKKSGGKAGLAAYGPGVESLSNKQLEALIKHTITVPRSTVTSLQKIDRSINLAASKGQKLTQEENANIVQRLKQINDTLSGHKYASNYVAPSAHSLTAGIKDRTERLKIQQRIAAYFGQGGIEPTAGAANGIPLNPFETTPPKVGPRDSPAPLSAAAVAAAFSAHKLRGNYPAHAGATPTKSPSSRGSGHAGGDVYINTVNVNGVGIKDVNVLRAELLKVSRRNGTQNKGPNSGHKQGL